MIKKSICILLVFLVMGSVSYAADIPVSTILEMLDEEELVSAVEVAAGLLEQYGYTVTIEKAEEVGEEVVQEEEDVVEPVDSGKFIKDFVSGWEARAERLAQDESRSATFSDKQYVEYMTEAVSREYEYIEKYRVAEFEDESLGQYYREYISALDDQLAALTEYYGKDDAAYNELWSNAYYKRCQAMYWMNRKWGLDFQEKYQDAISEMLSVGQQWDMKVAIESDISAQLSDIEYSFIDTTSDSTNVAPITLKNNTNYQIEYLSIIMEFLNDEGTVVDTVYLISENSVSSGASLESRKMSVRSHFSSVVFKCEYNYSNGYYYDQNKITITPSLQYAWDGVLSKNGSVAEGQAIYAIEGLTTLWDEETSWSKKLYVPVIKFSIKNDGTINSDEVTIHTVFTNVDTKEIWDEETSYVVGHSDSPLRPGYSKKVFVYSSVGFESKPAILPNLTAEIYVNGQLLETVEIAK